MVEHASLGRSLRGVGLGKPQLGTRDTEPGSEDFAKVTAVFDRAVADLKAAGASLVDPIVIPSLKELLAKRAVGPTEPDDSFKVFFGKERQTTFQISRGDVELA